MGKAKLKAVEVPQIIKLDLGCGKNKRDGFTGVDSIQLDGKVDVVHDLRKPWPWKDGTVAEAHCSHFVEHLTNFNDKWERVHFFNELYRVLIPGGTCSLIVPHWNSARYYGDPTHKEPISEWTWFYLLQSWRKDNAPHCDYAQAPGPQSYKCDFDVTYGYSMHPSIMSRNDEYKQYALSNFKEAAQDIIATLVKKESV